MSEEQGDRQPKRVRGVTTYKKLIAQKDMVHIIQFADDGTPIGSTHSQFSRYISVLVKEQVPITVHSWPEANADDKEKMWYTIKVKENIILLIFQNGYKLSGANKFIFRTFGIFRTTHTRTGC